MLKAANALVEEGMPDKVLDPLRELVMATLLARTYGPGDYEVFGKEG